MRKDIEDSLWLCLPPRGAPPPSSDRLSGANRGRRWVASWRESPPGDLVAGWVRGTAGKETAMLREGTGWQARGKGKLEKDASERAEGWGEGRRTSTGRGRLKCRNSSRVGLARRGLRERALSLTGLRWAGYEIRGAGNKLQRLCPIMLPLCLVLPGFSSPSPSPSSVL